jgi:hypothetical protein
MGGDKMKRFLFILCAIFICTFAFAQTIRWHVGDSIIRTDTCSSGDSVTPPTAPAKTGYHFVNWRPYIPIEYLESTGTQYIDTGYKPDQNTRVVTNVQVMRTEAKASWIFGTRSSAGSDDKYGAILITSSGLNTYRCDYGSNVITPTANIPLNNKKLTLDKNKNITTLYYDENLIQQTTQPATTFNSKYNLYLFDLNNGGISSINSANRIYSCKIWDNDVLVRDFIPALDFNGVPCMYDKVTKQFFYNQGTGDFIAGPAVGE